MVKQCGICHVKWSTSSDITFHAFPTDEEQKQKWFDALNVYPFPTNHVYVCSKHFTEDCFYKTTGKNKYLFKSAVPTQHLQLPSSSCQEVDKKEIGQSEKKEIHQLFVDLEETSHPAGVNDYNTILSPVEDAPIRSVDHQNVFLSTCEGEGTDINNHRKRALKMDHTYADCIQRDYKKMYFETKDKLTEAMKKIRVLNRKLWRHKQKSDKIGKFLKELKRHSFESASELLKSSRQGNAKDKCLVPKKMIILV